jgi:tetratricopeptide (TPR) repeat protein
VSTLTPDSDADLPQIRTRRDFGAALKALGRRRGLTPADIVKQSNGRLPRATVHDALSGKSLPSRQSLLMLLSACTVPEDDREQWLRARERVLAETAATAELLAGTDTFDSASPLELGIHSAIVTPDTTDDLPAYIDRDFDFKLRAALTINELNRGYFVILVGGSSTGKTRSLYEAVHDLAPNWRLFQPAETEDLLALKGDPPTQTVFWLDELQRYLGSRPPLSWECVRALTRKENIVVGTLWPDQYDARVRPGQLESAEAEDIRRLLNRATVIGVPDTFTPEELGKAQEVAEQDSRIRIALETRDAGLTQVLAGGPALMLSWELAPNAYAKAMITAAADAHRLGVQSPLSTDLLTGAMFGYLRRAQRVAPKEEWLTEALPHATRPLYGDVSALSPADGGAGVLAGYTIADYLAQHLRRRRRVDHVPHEAWEALVTRIGHAADLRRLANSAIARLRYRYAALALERLAGEFGDGEAAAELAALLVRQDRFESAIEVLRRQLAVDPWDELLSWHLTRTQGLRRRVEAIRPAADAGDGAARSRLIEILIDGGECDDFRTRADRGDVTAGEDLVERLVERGCVRELRERADRGHEYAAEALADLYVAWGDVDLLQARADLGDRFAQLRLTKVQEEGMRSAGAESEVEALRADATTDPEKARQLCALLFDLRDADGLRAELEAGTTGAADRLIALYTAQESMPPEQLAHLRAFGLTADGQLFIPDDLPKGH